jgi:hypothetical protein
MDPSVLILVANKYIESEPKKFEKYIQARELNPVRQIMVCAMSIRQVYDDNSDITESERQHFIETLKVFQETYKVDIAQLYHSRYGNGNVPPELHLMHKPGCQSYDKCGQNINFPVRGKNYREDQKKVFNHL